MPLVLYPAGGDPITLDQGDGPEEIGFEIVVDGVKLKRSDGSNYFQDTGLIPSDIVISGILEHNAHGNALDKMYTLYGLIRQTMTLTWDRMHWTVQLVKFTPAVLFANRVRYSLTCQVVTIGTLQAPAPARSAYLRTNLDQITQAASSVGPLTQAAVAQMAAARLVAGV